MPDIVQVSSEWLADTALSALSPLLTCYARTSSFENALTGVDDFALRRKGDDAQAFRHFDARLSGTIEPQKVKLTITGTTAAQLMRDVVSSYCTGPGGNPKRAQIASGARMVHLAAMHLRGDRIVRHVCYDTIVADPLTGQRVNAAKLVLRPLAPPPLILTPAMRIG